MFLVSIEVLFAVFISILRLGSHIGFAIWDQSTIGPLTLRQDTLKLKEPLRKVNDSIKDLLSGIRIADLADPPESSRHENQAAVGGGLVSIAV